MINDASVAIAVAIGSATADLSLITNNGDGTFSYDRADFDFLNEGEAAICEISFDVVSGSDTVAQTVTLTIDGANDAPVVTGPLSGSAAEGAATVTVDLLQGTSDVDDDLASLTVTNVMFAVDGGPAGETPPAGVTLSGTDLVVTPTDTAFDHINVGDSAQIVVTYDVTDPLGASVSQTATFTITGTNDTPVATLSTVATDEDSSISGTLIGTAVDLVDDGSTATFTPTSALPAGFTLNPDGSFSLDATGVAYDYLAVGEQVTTIVSYQVADEFNTIASGLLNVTVTGTNDALEVAAALSASAAEDDASFTVDLLDSASDVDAGAVLSATNVSGVPAWATLVGNSLEVDPGHADLQSLNVGDTATAVVSYTVEDEHGASVAQTATLTITGTNDTPEVAAALSASAAEDDAGFTVDLLDGASDVDTGAVLSVQNVSGVPAWAVLSGTFVTVDPGHADLQSLDAGDVLTATVSYEVVDEHGASVAQTATLTITGTNDAPVVSVADPAADTEGDTGTPDVVTVDLDSLLSASDVDADDTPAIDDASVSIAAAAGSATTDLGLVTDNGDGTFSYDRAAFDFLDDGEAAIYEISLDVVSGSDTVSQTVTLTISGANDAPAVSGPVLATEDEDALPILIEQDDLLSNASDVDLADAGALLAENLAISAGAGVLVDNGDGTWTFTPAADDDTEVSFTFDVTDGDETVAATGVIDLLPVNDDPVGTVSISGVAQEASELAVLVSGLADADGLGMLNYQWFADDVAIVGATGLTFTPGHDEVGSILTVEVSYTDGGGTLESLVSAPSLAVLDAAYNFIEGTDASELITGTDGQDAIFALLGDDTLVGGLGGDSLSGGDGFDIISYAGAAERARVDFLNDVAGNGRAAAGDLFTALDLGRVVDIEGVIGTDYDDLLSTDLSDNFLDGASGNDVLRAREGRDTMLGGDGDDELDGGKGRDRMEADDGNDMLIGRRGHDNMRGGRGDDTLDGGTGNDFMLGGSGNDLLIGGQDNDTMQGNQDSDTFVFADGHGVDVITDFEATNDAERIDFSGLSTIVDFDGVRAVAVEDGADVVITTGGASSIRLENVLLTDLDANDFIF